MLWHFCVKINENLFALCYWAATEAEAGLSSSCSSDFLLGFVFVTFRSLRYVAFRSFVRFSVCPKTFFHMHLSAKACHTPLPLLLLRPSSRLDTTLFDFGVPCRYGSAALFAIFHKILNIPFSLSWSIGTLFKSEQPLHFVYLALLFFFPTPFSPRLYPRYAISQAALGHLERLIIWQLVCEVSSFKARQDRQDPSLILTNGRSKDACGHMKCTMIDQILGTLLRHGIRIWHLSNQAMPQLL